MNGDTMIEGLEEESARVKLPELFKLVDQEKCDLIKLLKTAVSIPSMAHKEENFLDIVKMINFCAEELKSLGAKVELIEIEKNTEISMPPVIFASLTTEEEDFNHTICVYSSVDTPPIENSDEDSNPFELTEKDGRLFGCGVLEKKGPMIAWLNALRIYKIAKLNIPVNIKFIIEGTSESHSPSLERAIRTKPEFFDDIDYFCLTIDKRLNNLPCLKYGFRGICHFSLEIECGERNINSGAYGGSFQQPLIDATNFLRSLIDKDGKLNVPELLVKVRSLPREEEKLCKAIPLDVNGLKEELKVNRLKHKEKKIRLIMHKSRLPSISIHDFGMTINFAQKHNIALVPSRVIAKFSIRLVPDQTVKSTLNIIDEHLKNFWKKNEKVNSYKLNIDFGYDPWRQEPASSHYKAAASAIKTVYKIEPIYVCEGYSLPAVSILSKVCSESDLIVLPIR